jgi:hypothetical protein
MFKGAKITFNRRGSVIDCTVRNLSDTGALLEVQSTVGIPDTFELVFNDGGLVQPCRLVRRNATQLGVAFIE